MERTRGRVDVTRVIQITDLHLGRDREQKLAGINTFASFTEVLATILNEHILPHMVMVTGDIAAQGILPAYEIFSTEMQASGLPYAWLPGNHDSFEVMQEDMTAAPYWPMLDLGGWRLISLNTAQPGRVEGRLSDNELMFLEKVLASREDSPVAIFMHHPPLPVGSAWLDRQQLTNSGELEALIRRSGKVKALFTGHVHQEFAGEWAGCPVYTTPSTCFQFASNRADFALSEDPPGYRWIDFYSDGTFETGTIALAETSQKVDPSCTGY